jgi:hypothetical protein
VVPPTNPQPAPLVAGSKIGEGPVTSQTPTDPAAAPHDVPSAYAVSSKPITEHTLDDHAQAYLGAKPQTVTTAEGYTYPKEAASMTTADGTVITIANSDFGDAQKAAAAGNTEPADAIHKKLAQGRQGIIAGNAVQPEAYLPHEGPVTADNPMRRVPTGTAVGGDTTGQFLHSMSSKMADDNFVQNRPGGSLAGQAYGDANATFNQAGGYGVQPRSEYGPNNPDPRRGEMHLTDDHKISMMSPSEKRQYDAMTPEDQQKQLARTADTMPVNDFIATKARAQAAYNLANGRSGQYTIPGQSGVITHLSGKQTEEGAPTPNFQHPPKLTTDAMDAANQDITRNIAPEHARLQQIESTDKDGNRTGLLRDAEIELFLAQHPDKGWDGTKYVDRDPTLVGPVNPQNVKDAQDKLTGLQDEQKQIHSLNVNKTQALLDHYYGLAENGNLADARKNQIQGDIGTPLPTNATQAQKWQRQSEVFEFQIGTAPDSYQATRKAVASIDAKQYLKPDDIKSLKQIEGYQADAAIGFTGPKVALKRINEILDAKADSGGGEGSDVQGRLAQIDKSMQAVEDAVHNRQMKPEEGRARIAILKGNRKSIEREAVQGKRDIQWKINELDKEAQRQSHTYDTEGKVLEAHKKTRNEAQAEDTRRAGELAAMQKEWDRLNTEGGHAITPNKDDSSKPDSVPKDSNYTPKDDKGKPIKDAQPLNFDQLGVAIEQMKAKQAISHAAALRAQQDVNDSTTRRQSAKDAMTDAQEHKDILSGNKKQEQPVPTGTPNAAPGQVPGTPNQVAGQPAAPAQPNVAPEGTIITNKQGQRFIKNGGKWQTTP